MLDFLGQETITALINSLKVAGQGMLAIFLVMAVISLIVYITAKISSAKKK